jgi:DNA-binding transcriptional regulator YbjK
LSKREQELDDLVENQARSNSEVSAMMKESKHLVEEVEDRNRILEQECQVLRDKLDRMASQNEEMRGLMELYKEKYKTEKLSNRQAIPLSGRG